MEWQPIESAPEGDMILLCLKPHPGFISAPIKVGYLDAAMHEFRIFGGSWKPSHWMPLPEPPNE